MVKTYLAGFFDRNLFERIIIYLFVSEFIVRLIFELGLGQHSFYQSQNKQWVFYGLLALDYLISFNKVLNIRVRINALSLFALLLFVMILQGLFVGVMNDNKTFEIVNDTVPLLMIALNILRMQSEAEQTKPIDFRSLLVTVTYLAFGACMFGFIAGLIGKPSQASLPVVPVFLPIILAAAFMVRPFPWKVAVLCAIMVVLSVSEINRTTMAFAGAVVGVYAIGLAIKNPSRGLLLIVAAVFTVSTLWMLVPEDSKTYHRIVGITKIDLKRRDGSVGERMAEFDSINATLQKKGKTMEWVGLGFGGLYEFQSTHEYVSDYGHAHYSWAWFKLRFGYIGYGYLLIMASVLLWNCYQGIRSGHQTGLFVGLLCLQALLYLLTYVNAIFLVSGIHFLRINSNKSA